MKRYASKAFDPFNVDKNSSGKNVYRKHVARDGRYTQRRDGEERPRVGRFVGRRAAGGGCVGTGRGAAVGGGRADSPRRVSKRFKYT